MLNQIVEFKQLDVYSGKYQNERKLIVLLQIFPSSKFIETRLCVHKLTVNYLRNKTDII